MEKAHQEGVLGIRTRDQWVKGTDESTELWWAQMLNVIRMIYFITTFKERPRTGA